MSIMYLGSKEKLLRSITAIIVALPDVSRVGDLFAGSLRVSRALKRAGYWVHANDTATYSEVFGRCYIETDARAIDRQRIARLLAALQSLPRISGYFSRTFGVAAPFFSIENAMTLDAIRSGIDAAARDGTEGAILLTALLEAADRVSAGQGWYQAFFKELPQRALKPLTLCMPVLLAGAGAVTRMDANALASSLEVDVAYIDAPYSSHNYFSYYHVLETIVRNDAPPCDGVVMRRTDSRALGASDYNSRVRAAPALAALINALRAPWLLVSTSSEAIIPPEQIVAMLAGRGYVGSVAIPHKRHVASRTGIHNPAGEKVGTPGTQTNTEFLLLSGPDKERVEAAIAHARLLIPPVQLPLAMEERDARDSA